ncbi:MAG TPA: alkaline phosphatase PhoX [Candidatus Dormibacteraeota bacterium]|nr:alkaline phosphatase PhoX [Candidatus Dormibacteraeota bacterium]
MNRKLGLLAGAAALVLLCGYTRGPLILGPGSGVRTRTPPMVRPLREDVSVIPIISVGDSLAPPDTVRDAFLFAPEPDGLGIRKIGNGLAEIYVAHELSWHGGFNGARVSRLAIDLRNFGAVGGDYLVDGSEGYDRFGAASLVGPEDGFLAPTFLVNEESIDGIYRGIVVAVDARDGTVKNLPWLGHFSHESTVIVPVSSGKIVAILTENSYPGESQLYMYVANNDSDFLSGRGRLYVLRGDPPEGRPDTRLASLASKGRPLTGRFVPLFPQEEGGRINVNELPARLEAQAQGMGCLNFARLEDVTPVKDQPNAFYFVDTGADDFYDPVTGRPVTGAGRLYYVRLDPFNPTHVEELSVALDGDESDDLYRPDNLATDDRYVWIQEDPGGRGIHTARILRYDTNTRRVEPMAECAEWDAKGNYLPRGIGGEWESTGMVDASDLFGPDTWLIAVQANNLWLPQFRNRKGGGQLLLLRGPGYSSAKAGEAKSKPEKGAAEKKEVKGRSGG